MLLYRVLTADGIIGKGRQQRTHFQTESTLASSIPEGNINEDEDLFSSSDDDYETDLEEGGIRRNKKTQRNQNIFNTAPQVSETSQQFNKVQPIIN